MRLFLLFLGVIFSTISIAQVKQRILDPTNMRPGEHVEYCASHKKMEEAMKNPEYAAQVAAAELESNNPIKKNNSTPKGTVYTVPVVFHVLHMNGAENISDAQINDALAILNIDYRKLNADVANVQSEFQGITADIEIEFALARKAPNGACFTGITRTVTPLTFDGSDGQSQVNAVITGNDVYQGIWPHDEYLNVYVCFDIGSAAGYTFKPSGSSNASSSGMFYNGIFLLQNYTGSIGTSDVYTSRTLTHEVGHWLNLNHVWGPNNNPGDPTSCNIDDNVQDTPLCIGSNSCNYNANTCNDFGSNFSSWSYDVKDNVENYMDYSYCSKMFTEGQKTRMRNAVTSNTAGRSNLITASNHALTGINSPLVLCQAKFKANKTILCANDSITFTDMSFNAVTGWNWTFAGGTPSTSTLQNPGVVYTTPGTYTVTLTATDGGTSDVETMTNYITVLPNGNTLPYFEGFEGISNLSATPNWIVDNPSGNAWNITTSAAHSGSKSAKLTNLGQAAGSIDQLISSAIDLSSVDTTNGVTLSFRYAYKKASTTSTDILRVYFTANCGDTWAVRKTMSATTMSGSSFQVSSWTPTANDWTTVHMTNVTSLFWNENFRYKFEFTSNGGNNIYLDDINIYAGSPSENLIVAGIDETAFTAVNLYPNPADEELNISFHAINNEKMTIVLTDLTGKTIQTNTIQANEGENLVLLNTSDFAKGVYFVNLLTGTKRTTLQFVKK
jgi:PKD repeat protein